MAGLFPSSEYVRELENILAYYRYLHWAKCEVYSLPWWTMTVVTLAAIVVWVRLADRKNILEIMLYGSWVAILGVSLDEFGYEYRLWRYNYHIIAQFPHILWIHLFILPVIYMLIYQYFPKWKPFIKAMAVSAAAFAFIGEPILKWMGVYELLKWNYWYSFPLYLLMGVTLKGLLAWLKAKQAGV